MTTDITELAQRMKAAAEKATQGEWWSDEVKNEGCHGPVDDFVEGFTSYAIYGSDGQTLFDSLNSDAACICEEYDGEGHVAWDETAQRNAEFIALANPASVLALVEALEKAQQVDEELCKLPPPGAEYMGPPDGGDVTPLEGVRRMVADYRQRIAELEDYAEDEAVGADKVAENAVYWMKRCKELESRTVNLPDGWQFEECEMEGCENGAIFSVGTGSRNIHLCDKCARESQNSRLKKSPLPKRLPFKMSAGIKVEAE
ncbi:ead/Ea22-like family protein [Klebsiella variicola]|nr:ead/Ea22-like family protein [Klebsiella variicola]QOV59852.1 ead/Ea22-like family protein [Klebsiella variicola]CEP28686.1 hypothetical protein KV8917_160054 [Klebsiella variicola]